MDGLNWLSVRQIDSTVNKKKTFLMSGRTGNYNLAITIWQYRLALWAAGIEERLLAQWRPHHDEDPLFRPFSILPPCTYKYCLALWRPKARNNSGRSDIPPSYINLKIWWTKTWKTICESHLSIFFTRRQHFRYTRISNQTWKNLRPF